MRSIRRETVKHDIRVFGVGAASGFLAGALLVTVLVIQYGEAIGSRLQWLERRSPGSPAVQQVSDDAGAAVLAEEEERAEGTSGRFGAADARKRPSPSVAAPPEASVEDLRKRDLLVPVEGVDRAALKSQFSDPRGERHHEALDILAPRHTPVRAVEEGTIIRLFHSKPGGITVYQFDPSGRYCYYYAHLERYADNLREGQRVARGQVIGYVGTSGNAPEGTPHLHFAVFRLTPDKRWWEGTPIDPYEVLR